MKKIIIILIALVMFYNGQAQTERPNTFSDITLAKAAAQEQNVPILMIFAGSDWCKPCIQFKKSILLSESFTTYSTENIVVLYLDFPLKKANKLSTEQTAHNNKLAEKYNPSGAFPEILLMDANEVILGNLTFKNQSAEEFIASCQALNR